MISNVGKDARKDNVRYAKVHSLTLTTYMIGRKDVIYERKEKTRIEHLSLVLGTKYSFVIGPGGFQQW